MTKVARSTDSPDGRLRTGRDTRSQARYFIETWGCQMNVHDSEKLAGALESEGYVAARTLLDADVVLLNTCSIREKAAEKVFAELGRLRPLKQHNADLVIGVCGCVAQQEGERILSRAPHVDLVIGPRATASLPGMLEALRKGGSPLDSRVDTAYRRDSIEFPHDRIRRDGVGSAKAFVTVIEGCNHRCTYCIVPTTRGREVCRSMDVILEEVRSLVDHGVFEVEFLGQTVNAYRDEAGRTLGDLLLATSEVGGVERIRFTTSHPAQMTEALMDAMAAGGSKVCPYLHLPVQSGSSAVLRDMRRGYDRETYLAKIAGLRGRIPGLSFGTDIIVGFPTESEADFGQTLTLLDEVRFDTCYSFAYSARPGTVSATLDDAVPVRDKLDRLARLQAHQKEIQARHNQRWVGREVEVVVEGASKRDCNEWTGRTPENRVVNFGGRTTDCRKERIRVVAATAYSLRGEPVSHDA